MSRTNQSIKNAMVGVMGQATSIICQFACRTVFIYVLSKQYLGLNGLFLNILGMLSISELGFGSAMLYLMYKPIATNDKDKIIRYMNLYRIVYRIIAFIVLVIGLCLMPFLKYIIADSGYYEIKNINIIYLMYLINSVASYLLIYKQSLIEANQKMYIIIFFQKTFMIIQSILQIIVLLVWKNFIIYLAIQIGCTILCNIVISRKAQSMFPYLGRDNKSLPEKSELKEIGKNTMAMSAHKIGGTLVFGTDNMLMSAMVGLNSVGIYSNYSMIISTVNVFSNIIINSFSASIGHLSATEDKENIYKIYKSLFFINFWIISFCTVELFCLINPFMKVWIGKEYIFKFSIVIIIIVNFYINGMRGMTLRFRDALGIFWNDRYKPFFESIINLVASIVIAHKYGIIGILLGTTISTLLTSFWIEPYVFYKHGLKKGLGSYFYTYFKYTIIFIVLTYILMNVGKVFPKTLIGIIMNAIFIFFVYNSCIYFIFRKTDEWKVIGEKIRSIKAKLQSK